MDPSTAEVATEVRLLRAVEAELAEHAAVREQAYRRVDPEGLARSLPGVAEVGGPVLQAAVGRAERFGSASAFKRFTGLTPRASETGETDRKGQPMSKSGPHLLRTQLLRSADTARTLDPQLARVYYAQMVERGANHLISPFGLLGPVELIGARQVDIPSLALLAVRTPQGRSRHRQRSRS